MLSRLTNNHWIFSRPLLPSALKFDNLHTMSGLRGFMKLVLAHPPSFHSENHFTSHIFHILKVNI